MCQAGPLWALIIQEELCRVPWGDGRYATPHVHKMFWEAGGAVGVEGKGAAGNTAWVGLVMGAALVPM